MSKSAILTGNLLELNLTALDGAIGELQDAQYFDITETLETTLLLMRALRNADILPWQPEDADVPMTGDMNTLRDLCTEMKALQLKALDLKAQATEVRIPLDVLRLKKIPELMESLGVKTATFQGLGRVQTAPDLYCSTRKGCKDDAMQWLRDCGYADMIKETYNASSMKALIRRLIVDGVEVPEFMNVTPFTRASIVKA